VRPFERLDEATAPDGTLMTLYRHDGAYLIRVDGVELMSTRRSHSERELARLACAPIAGVVAPQVLIGGLGFGFTLRAALDILPADARIVVAELVPQVIAWNQNPEYDLAGDALRDPRVDLRQTDVSNVLRDSPGAFDAVMLDVDNGAEPLTTADNGRLYGAAGIRRTLAALKPAGHVAYWSATPAPQFMKLLGRVGLEATAEQVRAHLTSGPLHTIIVARRTVKVATPA
jgi:spermidine synthase